MKFLAQIVSEYIPFYARIATLPPPFSSIYSIKQTAPIPHSSSTKVKTVAVNFIVLYFLIN